MNRKSALNEIKNIENNDLQALFGRYDEITISEEKNNRGCWNLLGWRGNCSMRFGIEGSTYRELIIDANRYYSMDDGDDEDEDEDNY